MSRVSIFSNPLLLGFDEVERLVDRAAKSGGDSYPPYNIEQLEYPSGAQTLRITIAVAGFRRDDLEINVEESQLTIEGKQQDDPARNYLHRGIAARQFKRSFVLAEGIEVTSADLRDGLLSIDLNRPQSEKTRKKIKISQAY